MTGSTKFRGKITTLYETHFGMHENAQDSDDSSQPGRGRELPINFKEFFLLKPNLADLEEILYLALAQDDLYAIQAAQKLIDEAITLTCEYSNIGSVHALMTLFKTVTFLANNSQSLGSSGDSGLPAPGFCWNVLFDGTSSAIQNLPDRLCTFLNGNYPSGLKDIAIDVLLLFATLGDAMKENPMIEIFMVSDVFGTCCQILARFDMCSAFGRKVVCLLLFLINYRKYAKSINPCLVKMSILDDELALKGYSLVVACALSDCNRSYREQADKTNTSGMMSSLTNAVANLFVPPEDACVDAQTDEAMLMAMYDAVHLNRNFVTFLTNLHAQPATSPPADAPTVAPDLTVSSSPTNLLVEFLTHTSILMQDLKSPNSLDTVKLCMITLTCIAEDQYANNLMHDVNMTFRVPLVRIPMRHRRPRLGAGTSQPLACAVLDLCVEFLMGHLTRSLCMDMYARCLSVIHRIVCYEKKCRVRLAYAWRDLVNTLAVVTKFVVQHEASHELLPTILLVDKAVTILNLFITFGDTFLPDAATFDELYYEIVRNWDVFEMTYSFALRHATLPIPPSNAIAPACSGTSQSPPSKSASDQSAQVSNSTNVSACLPSTATSPVPQHRTVHSEAALRLCHHMANVKMVAEHFRPLIDAAAAAAGCSLTESEIMTVIQGNYDSLRLRLLDNLDSYERYSERPHGMLFFQQTMYRIMRRVRESLARVTFDHASISKEFNLLRDQRSVSLDSSADGSVR